MLLSLPREYGQSDQEVKAFAYTTTNNLDSELAEFQTKVLFLWVKAN